MLKLTYFIFNMLKTVNSNINSKFILIINSFNTRIKHIYYIRLLQYSNIKNNENSQKNSTILFSRNIYQQI